MKRKISIKVTDCSGHKTEALESKRRNKNRLKTFYGGVSYGR